MWLFTLVVAAGLALGSLLPVSTGWAPFVMVVLAYAAGRRLASLARAVAVFTAVAVAGLALAVARTSEPISAWSTMALVELFAAVLPWWAGRYQRLNAERREREHGIVAEQARLRERARIAQDMHDTIGHELALIALHSGALEVGAGLTDAQRKTAGELRSHAVRATERLHDLVRVLGSSDAAAGQVPPDESIEDLVGRSAAAGMPVRLVHEGAAPQWPPMTRQAAHRVVREALTNAARHAPGAAVVVTVAADRIAVENEEGPSARGRAGSGQGLIGLAERVRLVGGQLSAGPRPGGGWLVRATLPADSAPARPASFDVAVSRRITRRRLLQTAALPVGVVLALLAALVAGQVATVRRTGLADDRYASLRIGQPQAQVEPLLPPEVAQRFRLVDEPTAPAGSTCRYYHAGDALTDLEPQVYRLCFAGGVLVAKNRLDRA
ncbi:sensor histidine kinase [Actinoplanes sp. NPDC051513]|uniref:sensor histidine kinase n=1 Tax=Actinoplanes sp. NPDC051513 TaxID=3363908 RepID=UPI0037993D0F